MIGDNNMGKSYIYFGSFLLFIFAIAFGLRCYYAIPKGKSTFSTKIIEYVFTDYKHYKELKQAKPLIEYIEEYLN
jgi:hypothetical protein